MGLPVVRYIPTPLRTERLAATYATLDPRSLAAGRIALAVALLIDLFNRWRQLPFWYTNLGLLPNHTLLWRPKFPFTFSLFFAASNQFEAHVGFVICFLSYVALLFGYRTKLAQITSLLCVLSLHGRLLFIQGGGDVVLGELALWTAFLPMGHRISLDAVRRRLSGLGRADEAQGRIYRLAVLALILQLALIYLLNAAQKTGETWKAGTAVYYVLHQSRIVTRFGLWLRCTLPIPWFRLATWVTLGIEWSLPVLLLSPVAVSRARSLAVALLCVLHIGFATGLNLAIFPVAMMAFAPNLLPATFWTTMSTWSQRRPRFAAAVVQVENWMLSLARWTLRVDPVRPARAPLGRLPALLSNIAVAGLMLIAGSELLVKNPALGRFSKMSRPVPAVATVQYLQLFQGWSMFAPDAPHDDMNLIVDAVTVSGRHVDPLNEVASPAVRNPGPTVPDRLGQSVFFCNYLTRIPYFPAYHQALTEWILRYPDRTGDQHDQIQSFRVLTVEQQTPPPGESAATMPHTSLVLQYP